MQAAHIYFSSNHGTKTPLPPQKSTTGKILNVRVLLIYFVVTQGSHSSPSPPCGWGGSLHTAEGRPMGSVSLPWHQVWYHCEICIHCQHLGNLSKSYGTTTSTWYSQEGRMTRTALWPRCPLFQPSREQSWLSVLLLGCYFTARQAGCWHDLEAAHG